MVGTNYSLCRFSTVMRHLGGLKKPLCGGEPIPNIIDWKAISIAKALKTSINGLAFTVYILTLS